MGENNCKWKTDKGLISKINKHWMKVKTRKTNKPIKTWSEDLNKHFSKEKPTDGQQTHEDVQRCSILEKCNSKLQWAIISHLSEWTSNNQQTINAGEGVEKGNPLALLVGM